MRKTPVVIELDDDTGPGPEQAPPVPDALPVAQGRAMAGAIRFAGARRSRLGRFGWAVAGALFSFILSVAAWDFVSALLARSPVLGMLAAVLFALALAVLALLALREWAALARLGRLDGIRNAAEVAIAGEDPGAARGVLLRLRRLYSGRADLRWGLDRMAERTADSFDADQLIGVAETELMTPLDTQARAEVEAAARQVAMVTAVVPLALADVAAALFANLRMIRRIAEIYGGRAGTFGSWRLARAVMGHLVATGAVAVGDDLLGSLAGGGVLSKLSRRFGEGVVNGALTARVGVAAIEVCRPLPFMRAQKPRASGLVSRALAGLFGRTAGRGEDADSPR
ncbi:MAG: TIGR01620 family protein [Paracoccaceae bacterium]